MECEGDVALRLRRDLEAEANLYQKIVEKVKERYDATDVVREDNSITANARLENLICREDTHWNWTVGGILKADADVKDRCRCLYSSEIIKNSMITIIVVILCISIMCAKRVGNI